MRTNVYAVYDVKAQAYATPFFMPSTGLAIRAFSEVATDQNSQLCKHAEDFSLYKIGEFDDNEGKLITLTNPEYLTRASDFKIEPVKGIEPVKDLEDENE